MSIKSKFSVEALVVLYNLYRILYYLGKESGQFEYDIVFHLKYFVKYRHLCMQQCVSQSYVDYVLL